MNKSKSKKSKAHKPYLPNDKLGALIGTVFAQEANKINGLGGLMKTMELMDLAIAIRKVNNTMPHKEIERNTHLDPKHKAK